MGQGSYPIRDRIGPLAAPGFVEEDVHEIWRVGIGSLKGWLAQTP